jgi:transcriptional regulator GlxA family with amidase domain
MTRAIVTPPSAPGESLLGVRFHPGAAFRVLGVAARELRDATALVHDVWGAVGRELAARVADTRSMQEALRVVDEELRSRAMRARPSDHRLRSSIEAIRETRGMISVRDLGERARVGERQLERLFDERVGIGPKMLARVVRLQTVALLVAAAQGRRESWAAIAGQAGYADQAHMIRELRALAGVSPEEYAAARAMSDSFNAPLGPLPILGA